MFFNRQKRTQYVLNANQITHYSFRSTFRWVVFAYLISDFERN